MKEILKTLVETMTLPEDSYLEQDAEIFEILLKNWMKSFVELEPLIGQWIEQPTTRCAHRYSPPFPYPLKGFRENGVKSSGELAWTVEDTLNRVISGTVSLNTEFNAMFKRFSIFIALSLYMILRRFKTFD